MEVANLNFQAGITGSLKKESDLYGILLASGIALASAVAMAHPAWAGSNTAELGVTDSSNKTNKTSAPSENDSFKSTTISAEDAEKALKSCQAATWDEQAQEKQKKHSKKGPLRKAAGHTAGFLATGIGNSTEGVGRDLLFVFSARNDLDPYAGKAPSNKPYEFASFRLVDGTMCSLTKYPDGSEKIVGGFADGTIIAPVHKDKYVVGYPNGALGTMVKVGEKYIIYRPDKTTTTVEKTASGNYKVHNSKFGYMGEGLADQTGLRYDFGSLGKGTF